MRRPWRGAGELLPALLAATVACAGSRVALAPPADAVDAVSARGLHYRVSGRGDPVVLVHAFQTDLREWDEVEPILARSRRVIRYDSRGHGRSPATASFSHHEDLDNLLSELGVDLADVVGLSMGATIALDFALEHPTRVRRLVLVSPGVPGVASTASFDWMQPILAAVRARDTARAAELWWATDFFAATRARGDGGLRYRAVVMDNAHIWLGDRRLERRLDPPAGARLEELRAPLLAVVGEHDVSDAPRHADTLVARAAGARRLTIAGAGHMVSTDRPAELAAAVLDFLGR